MFKKLKIRIKIRLWSYFSPLAYGHSYGMSTQTMRRAWPVKWWFWAGYMALPDSWRLYGIGEALSGKIRKNE